MTCARGVRSSEEILWAGANRDAEALQAVRRLRAEEVAARVPYVSLGLLCLLLMPVSRFRELVRATPTPLTAAHTIVLLHRPTLAWAFTRTVCHFLHGVCQVPLCERTPRPCLTS